MSDFTTESLKLRRELRATAQRMCSMAHHEWEAELFRLALANRRLQRLANEADARRRQATER